MAKRPGEIYDALGDRLHGVLDAATYTLDTAHRQIDQAAERAAEVAGTQLVKFQYWILDSAKWASDVITIKTIDQSNSERDD
jgi:hypothetical protein